MSLLRNRIVISLLIIVAVATWWEFGGKPVTGPLYVQAAEEYKKGNHERSLELLERAYQIDPNDATTLTLFGWNYLKLKRFAEAEPYFDRALKLDPSLVDARRGLAHTWLELGDAQKALDQFNKLPRDVQNTTDVRIAMARANRMVGNNQQAMQLLTQVLKEEPENALAIEELEQLAGSGSPEVVAAMQAAAPPRPATLQVAARLENGRFHVREGNTWKQLYVAGVNIGPARPGHFPSEPPTRVETYAEWLERIDALGANAIRVYTLLPPAFYRALQQHNTRNPQRPLYLFQGIWLKDPTAGNLYEREFAADFENEIRDLVDVIHGRASLPVQRGRPGGLFSADVSPYVLGWMVGREIEPRVVILTNLRNPQETSFRGRYLKIDRGSPTEVWLTRMCEKVTEYEVEKYNWQRPVSWVSWPPLDPLYHPSESSMAEEWQLRRLQGELLPPLQPGGIYDDIDVVALDEERVDVLPAFQAGFYATTHIYPFYPDFIIHDPRYRQASDREGINSYWGYLQDLKSHYRKTPVLVAEYGLSTSLGIAHFNPYAWHHGGLEEGQQGQTLVRLTKNIHDAGYAGGIVFSWLEEWWKHNWITAEFAQPYFRTALWHNDMDPEQFFGLQKFVPVTPPAPQEVYRAPAGETAPYPRLQRVTWWSDASALYLSLQLDESAGEQLDWDKANYAVALNTCGQPCGSRKLPLRGLDALRYARGFNFLLTLAGPTNARLLVARTYNPYHEVRVGGVPRLTDIILLRGQRIEVLESDEFEEMVVETNRRRYGRDGTFYPSERYSRSVLVQGNFDPTQPGYTSLGQWYYHAPTRELRVRLSWGLLLAMDPSSGYVFWGTDERAKPKGTKAEQLSFAAFAYSPAGGAPPQVAPGTGSNEVQAVELPWPGWERLDYKMVPKKSYDILRPEFERLTGRRPERRR